MVGLSSLGSVNKGAMFIPFGAPLSKRHFPPLSARGDRRGLSGNKACAPFPGPDTAVGMWARQGKVHFKWTFSGGELIVTSKNQMIYCVCLWAESNIFIFLWCA